MRLNNSRGVIPSNQIKHRKEPKMSNLNKSKAQKISVNSCFADVFIGIALKEDSERELFINHSDVVKLVDFVGQRISRQLLGDDAFEKIKKVFEKGKISIVLEEATSDYVFFQISNYYEILKKDADLYLAIALIISEQPSEISLRSNELNWLLNYLFWNDFMTFSCGAWFLAQPECWELRSQSAGT